MPALPRLLPLLAVTAIAFLAAHGPALAAALSLDSPRTHFSRHHDIALSKRDLSGRRCKERTNSSETHSTGTKSTTAHSNSNNDAAMPKVGIAYPISDYAPLKAFKTSHVGP
jgi:hypothetical protein